jgi:hypothetical protein
LGESRPPESGSRWTDTSPGRGELRKIAGVMIAAGKGIAMKALDSDAGMDAKSLSDKQALPNFRYVSIDDRMSMI